MAHDDPRFEVHPRLERDVAASRPHERGEPPLRRLRIFTGDPTASKLAGRSAVATVPYEPLEIRAAEPREPRDSRLNAPMRGAPASAHEAHAAPGDADRPGRGADAGPVLSPGEAPHDCLCSRLFEVHMLDPAANGRSLAPPRLDDHEQLMQDGYAPSESNPRFHAQMAYAVLARVHADFRRALGREPGWGFEPNHPRLKVYPLRSGEANAWYDRDRGELVFGAFECKSQGWISTALMHDIVAHELTHALLDSQRPHFMDPTGRDVAGFHEGFADLIALFQHFHFREPLEAALRASAGVLYARDNAEHSAHWLCRIARQFGAADGADALRRADRWPNELSYREPMQEHDQGELLLSAVFDAFDTVFRRRTARLRRLASGGSGIVPPGEMHPDLLDDLADEAASLARRFMAVTVRALDYCPPANIELGEYLRAMITADALLVPDDRWCFREALIDAFRARKILPLHVTSLTEDSLLWGAPEATLPDVKALSFAETRFEGGPGRPIAAKARYAQALDLGQWLMKPGVLRECGLVAPGDPALATAHPGADVKVGRPCIDALDVTSYASPDGDIHFHTVAVVTQPCTVKPHDGEPGIAFRCGGTLLFDAAGRLTMAVRKSVLGKGRITRRLAFAKQAAASDGDRWQVRDGMLVLRPDWLRCHHLKDRRPNKKKEKEREKEKEKEKEKADASPALPAA